MKVKLNVPNILSLIRIFSTPFFIMSLFYFSKFTSSLIFISIALTDLFDGYIARRTKQVSEEGKMLDPVADRIFIMSAIIFMGFLFDSKLFLLLTRELLATPGLIIVLIYNKPSINITYIGKITTFLQAITITLFLWGFSFTYLAIFFTSVFGVISGTIYTKKALLR